MHVYDNNQPVSGTLKSWEIIGGQQGDLIEDDRLTYTVTNGQVSKIKLEMLQSAIETDLMLSYTSGNLTRIASQGQIEYTAEFGFGTHRPVFPKVSKYVLDHAGFSLQFASNNEMVSASFDFPGTDYDGSVSTQYTYDSDGYVLTSNDGTTQMAFEYQ